MDDQTDPPKSRSGAEIGAENFGKLQDYFAQLEREGGQVPFTKEGRPNLSAIALSCGFDRQVLYSNPRCKELVQAKVRSIGGTTETIEPTAKAMFDPKDKRIRELEKQVADLTERLSQAEKELAAARPYQRLYQHACETGRTLVP